ncbi:MAG: hypothetical protein KDN22_14930 [Verrucomicrobiae bacterium]|nr:hypothetical protein [Verrucomicrobiae bacterium]
MPGSLENHGRFIETSAVVVSVVSGSGAGPVVADMLACQQGTEMQPVFAGYGSATAGNNAEVEPSSVSLS